MHVNHFRLHRRLRRQGSRLWCFTFEKWGREVFFFVKERPVHLCTAAQRFRVIVEAAPPWSGDHRSIVGVNPGILHVLYHCLMIQQSDPQIATVRMLH